MQGTTLFACPKFGVHYGVHYRGLVIACQGRVWWLEFKVPELGDGQWVLDRIRARGDHHRYAGQPVTLIGMDFSREQCNLGRLRLGVGGSSQQ